MAMRFLTAMHSAFYLDIQASGHLACGPARDNPLGAEIARSCSLSIPSGAVCPLWRGNSRSLHLQSSLSAIVRFRLFVNSGPENFSHCGCR
jgi:hypothetical protein